MKLLNMHDLSISFSGLVRLLEENGCHNCQGAAAAIRYMIDINNTQTIEVRELKSEREEYEGQLMQLEQGILRFADTVRRHVGQRQYAEILND